MTYSAESFRGKSVLITGGLGTVGSTIARHLVPAGARVTLVDCMVPEYGGNLFNIEGIEDDLTVDHSDIRDPEAVRRIIAGQEVIFNLAGLGCHSDSMKDPLRDLDMNTRGHLGLLEACREQNPETKIVYASTRQVYGIPDALPVDESHPARPVDVNGVSKLAAEQFHLLYHRAHGMHTCALRMSNVLGPRMRVKDSRQVFYGGWFRALLEGGSFEVWGGKQIRDIEDVDDVARAFLAAASSGEADGRVFNTGSGKGVSLRELADLLVAAGGQGGYAIKEFPPELKRIDIGDYVADISSIRESLGWEPQVSLDDAVARSVEFYREHLNRYV